MPRRNYICQNIQTRIYLVPIIPTGLKHRDLNLNKRCLINFTAAKEEDATAVVRCHHGAVSHRTPPYVELQTHPLSPTPYPSSMPPHAVAPCGQCCNVVVTVFRHLFLCVLLLKPETIKPERVQEAPRPVQSTCSSRNAQQRC